MRRHLRKQATAIRHFAYIIRNTTLSDIDVDVFEITATVQYGGILHVGHYAALNGGDFDSIDANMQQLIKEPLDLNGAVQDALRGVRSS
jgi:hypothetical protein